MFKKGSAEKPTLQGESYGVDMHGWLFQKT